MPFVKLNGDFVAKPGLNADLHGVDPLGETTITVSHKGLDWEVDVGDIYDGSETWYSGELKCPNCGAIHKDDLGVADEQIHCESCHNKYEVRKWATSTKNQHYDCTPIRRMD